MFTYEIGGVVEARVVGDRQRRDATGVAEQNVLAYETGDAVRYRISFVLLCRVLGTTTTRARVRTTNLHKTTPFLMEMTLAHGKEF